MGRLSVKGAARRARRAALWAGGSPVYSGHVATFDAVPGVGAVDSPINRTLTSASSIRTLHTRDERLEAMYEPERRRSEYRARVATVPDGRLVTDSGVVVTPEGDLVLETLWDEYHLGRNFARPPRLRKPTPIPGTVASLVSLWSGTYYHWMLEGLPRLAVLEAAGHMDVRVVVAEQLTRFQRQSLEIAGVGEERLVPFVNEHISADVLVWAAAPAFSGNPTPFTVDWLRTRMRGSSPRRHRRLYVSRADNRRVANEDALVAMLEPYGFETVRPETLSLREQVQLFAAAEAVVAAHGAGLTNIVFSDHLALLELFPPGYVPPHYYALSCAAGHDYWYLVGQPLGGELGPKSSDFAVSLDLVKASVEAMLAGLQRGLVHGRSKSNVE